jgi:hypothetical protein
MSGTLKHHLAELVQRQRMVGDPAGPRFFARCRCGWSGPDRPTVQAANDDAIVHEHTQNPID